MDEQEWLLCTLTQKRIVPTKYSFAIPATVFYRNGVPDAQYYSAFETNRHVLYEKNIYLISQTKIIQEFANQLLRVGFYTKLESHFQPCTLSTAFCQFFSLHKLPLKTYYIQKLIGLVKSHLIYVRMDKSKFWFQQLQNVNEMGDDRVSVRERMITFEDHDVEVDEVECSAELIARLKKCCREIVHQVKTYQQLNIISANFFFQQGTDDVLYLIMVTSIRVETHTQGLNGMRGVNLEYFNVPQDIKRSFRKKNTKFLQLKMAKSQSQVVRTSTTDMVRTPKSPSKLTDDSFGTSSSGDTPENAALIIRRESTRKAINMDRLKSLKTINTALIEELEKDEGLTQEQRHVSNFIRFGLMNGLCRGVMPKITPEKKPQLSMQQRIQQYTKARQLSRTALNI